MIRVKDFDSTGVAPNGRVYAADLNAIQDAAAGKSDFTQNLQAASLAVGDATLVLSKIGTGDGQFSGSLRIQGGLLKAVDGLMTANYTTAQRDALTSRYAETSIIIYNTTTEQLEWNSGTNTLKVWKQLGINKNGQMTFDGGNAGAYFTNLGGSAIPILTSRRTVDSVDRFQLLADGRMEWGVGNTARDIILFRFAADWLKTDDIFEAAAGLITRIKAGTPTDADWPTAPGIGTLVVDTSGSKLWVRTAAGTWKSTNLV